MKWSGEREEGVGGGGQTDLGLRLIQEIFEVFSTSNSTLNDEYLLPGVLGVMYHPPNLMHWNTQQHLLQVQRAPSVNSRNRSS